MRNLIVYQTSYGGQQFKQRDPIKVIDTVNNFLSVLTKVTKADLPELTIFESPQGEKNYDSDSLLKKAFDQFGVGTRKQWATGVREEFNWTWIIKENDILKTLEFLKTERTNYHYELIPPIQISFSYWFKWLNPRTNELLKFQEDEFYHDKWFTQNHMMIMIDKTTSIMADFNFPFEEANEEFWSLKNVIERLLPIDLKDKNFRLLVPKNKEKDYVRKKIKPAANNS